MVHLDRPLDSTVIRIPLRNASQTLKNDISTLLTTPTEIQEVLRNFSAEFGTYGLLYMRNVTKLAIESAEMSLTIKMIADGDIQTHKATIIDAVNRALNDPKYDFHYNFQAGIRYTHDGISTTTSFMIQHSILNTLGISLRPWSQEQQYIPWVAIAAQLPSSQMNSTQCSLFTVLPLPVRTTQPVHIHALFSLTPDRANLHRMHDQSAQNQDPAKWNEWLLREGASVAWVKLLSALAQLYPLQSAFDQWPRAVDNNRDPLSGAVDRIVAIIQQDHLALWPTEIGYVRAETGFLALGSESPGLKEALRDANVPVTYVPIQLWDHAKKLFGPRLLSSANVCAYLNSKPAVVRGLRDRVKIALLEFLVSAPAVIDYGRLELFPFEDGEFRSLDGVNAFVHRDSAEKDLFSRQPELNLALGRLPEQTQRIFVDGCESRTLHPSIRFRSVDSFRDYCSRTFFAGFDQALEAHALDTDGAGFVTSAWSWILDRKISIKDENLSALWLLPMSDGQYRQLRYKQIVIYVAPPGLSGDIMRRMDAEFLASSRPLLLTGKASLGRRSSAVVTTLLQAKCIGVFDALNLLVYVQWLLWAMPLVTTTGDKRETI
ncbi:hypothetical protein WAI453_004346 [Rhynchosporium graminicola]